MTLVFLHGLETGPHGSKYQALRELDADLLAPDCEHVMDLDARMAIVERDLADKTDLVLVGSSFGGLVAALFADRHPDRVRAYLLCAPALHENYADGISRVPERACILHGKADDVVPIAASRAFGKRFGVPVIEVDDNHRLSDSRALLVDLTRKLLRPTAAT